MPRRTQTKPVANSRQALDEMVRESQLQKDVFSLAHALGFHVFHTYDSVLGSKAIDPGFPDAILAKDGRVLAIEFKTERGKLSLKQSEWLYSLSARGQVETYCWRPRDWSSGEIERVLIGRDGHQRAA